MEICNIFDRAFIGLSFLAQNWVSSLWSVFWSHHPGSIYLILDLKALFNSVCILHYWPLWRNCVCTPIAGSVEADFCNDILSFLSDIFSIFPVLTVSLSVSSPWVAVGSHFSLSWRFSCLSRWSAPPLWSFWLKLLLYLLPNLLQSMVFNCFNKQIFLITHLNWVMRW